MARIAYSCCGEGRGHSSRTLFIASQLIQRGHDLRVYASNAAYAALRPRLERVTEIPGFSLQYERNRVRVSATVLKNLAVWRGRSPVLHRLSRELCEFRPHLVITDFEPFLPIAARSSGFPFISVDHQHVIPGLRLKPPLKYWPHYLATLAVVHRTHSGEKANLVTSFFHPPRPAGAHYHYFAPILRKEITTAKPSVGPHVLVYQTSASFARLPEVLRTLPLEFRIYAFPREGTDGNCVFKPRNHPDFIDDLASCSWVLTNGGYTLMSEALALRKPVLSIPVGGQFEQWINSYHLQKLGYGEMCESERLSAELIEAFDQRKELYRSHIAARNFDGNTAIIERLLSFLP